MLPSRHLSCSARRTASTLRCIRQVPAKVNGSSSKLASYHTTSLCRQSYDSNEAKNPSRSSGSLFSSGSTWDSMLDEIDRSSTRKSSSRSHPPEPSKPRQTLTERESKVLTDMLDMIFTQKDSQPSPSSPTTTATAPSTTAEESPTVLLDEVGPKNVNDLFGRLRRIAQRKPSQKVRLATAEQFDMKKEEMEKCTNDQELLDWADREVFAESVRYEQAAREAVARAAQSPDKKRTLLPLQSPIYPQLIAHLMRTFRVTYRDPNLALYIFNHAQKLSIVSYTFGCSTDAYNELIETRWSSFRDLQGVLNALLEMQVNAVRANNRTQQLVEQARREIGQSLSDSNISRTLQEIETTIARLTGVKEAKFTSLNAWKRDLEIEGDGGFNDWLNLEQTFARKPRKVPAQKAAVGSR